jgi:hypothetical protein
MSLEWKYSECTLFFLFKIISENRKLLTSSLYCIVHVIVLYRSCNCIVLTATGHKPNCS